MPTDPSDNPALHGGSTELVQIFRALGGDYRERLERFNGRGDAPLDQAAREEWMARWKPEQDVIQRHPIVQLCQHTSDLTGIDISDLREFAMRISREGLAGFKPDVPFLSEREDLLWILPRLHDLDRDGSTPGLLEQVIQYCEQSGFDPASVGLPQPAVGLAKNTKKAGSEGDGRNGGKAKRVPKIEWLAKAMLTVKDHWEWSDSRIADKVGVHRSTLSTSPEYKAAAAMARGQKTDVPRGYKDSKTGEMDSWDP